MAAPNRQRVFVFVRAFFEGDQQAVDADKQNVTCANELHIEASVQYVGRGHTLVDETCLVADVFGKVRQEGDDVVLGLCFDGVNSGNVELSGTARSQMASAADVGIVPRSAIARAA